MTESKHTPGPWRVYMSRGFHVIGIGRADTAEGITDGGFGVWGGGDAESHANANLIAAAPDLYGALNGILDHYTALVNSGDAGNWDPETEAPVVAARAALAKVNV